MTQEQKDSILIIKVPENCLKDMKQFKHQYSSVFFYDSKGRGIELYLGPNKFPTKWELIGVTPLSEEQCEKVVDKRHGHGDYVYFNYIDRSAFGFKTAAESFSSYLKANGCHEVNPFGSTMPDTEPEFPISLSEMQDAWDQCEQRTGPFVVLKRKD